jgi:hypothetical protein
LKAPILRQEKLMDITNTSGTEVTFEAPVAVNCAFVISGTPLGIKPTVLNGRLRVYEKSNNVVNLTISSNTLIPCNWLDQYGVSGLIVQLSGTNSSWNLEPLLASYHVYSVRAEGFPTNVSLWLCYSFPYSWQYLRRPKKMNVYE